MGRPGLAHGPSLRQEGRARPPKCPAKCPSSGHGTRAGRRNVVTFDVIERLEDGLTIVCAHGSEHVGSLASGRFETLGNEERRSRPELAVRSSSQCRNREKSLQTSHFTLSVTLVTLMTLVFGELSLHQGLQLRVAGSES